MKIIRYALIDNETVNLFYESDSKEEREKKINKAFDEIRTIHKDMTMAEFLDGNLVRVKLTIEEEIDYQIWKTKEGEYIHIKDMTTKHIKNCLAMMYKNGYCSLKDQQFYLTCSEPSGEMAQYAFQQEQDYYIARTGSEYIDNMEAELESRKEKEDENK